MKVIYSILPILIFFLLSEGSQIENLQSATPQVKILISDEKKIYTWKEQVRYSVNVSDPKDGESKYGEIPSQESILTLEYLPGDKEEDIKKAMEKNEEKGLSLMKKSTCFGCHAQKTKISGPSFQEIAKRYEVNENTVKTLGDRILNGSLGIWGDQQMPAHHDFTEDECQQIAKYILETGDDPNYWVYAGLEGVFRIKDKPESHFEGVGVLTARYISTSGSEGKHSVVLKIR